MLGEVESEFVFDDIYLSLLMRRHCRNGAFKVFEYLLTERIMKTKDSKFIDNLIKILTSRDKYGYTLLHCAAEGGSIDIIRAIIKSMNQVNETFKIKIDDTTYDGRRVLHLISFIIFLYCINILLCVENYWLTVTINIAFFIKYQNKNGMQRILLLWVETNILWIFFTIRTWTSKLKREMD